MRRIRVLGLAAVTALALAALPTAASASGGLEADSYPTGLFVDSVGTHTFHIPPAGFNYCSLSDLEFYGALKGPSGTITAMPYWKSCTAPTQANGCKFEFHPGTGNSFDIGPPGCSPITTKMGGSSCTIQIGSQTGLPATYENVGEGKTASVVIDVSVGTIEYTKSGSFCVKGPFKDGHYSGEWKFSGYDAVNPAIEVGIRATDGFNGFFMAGKKSENEAEQPRFEAEKFPIAVSGQQDAGSPLTLSLIGSPMTCGSAQFSSEPTKATSTLAVAASLTNCVWEKEKVVVAMNSCYFAYNVTQAFTENFIYIGGLGIGCAKEGDAIEVIWPNCTVRFSSQGPTGSMLYLNGGSGSSRAVQVGTQAPASFSSTRKGLCEFFGKTGTEKFSASFVLQGP